MFMYLAHQAVHSANSNQPIQAPKDIIANFSHIENERRRIFAAMATVLDQSVGKVQLWKSCEKGLLVNKLNAINANTSNLIKDQYHQVFG